MLNAILPALVCAVCCVAGRAQVERRLNVLLLTADDLNADTPGCFGGPVDGITPHLDALAAEGLRFRRAHVTIAVCQPSRSVLLTGRYPHHNGAVGFGPVAADCPTLVEGLRDAGYLTGILGKTSHLTPPAKFPWDVKVARRALGEGRSPERYAAETRAFLARAAREGKPFFLMANSHDPHRPFAGSAQERRQAERRKLEFPPAPRTFAPDAVPVPGFLPDLPDVRREIAQYHASVHRGDATIGAVLAELDATGHRDDTIVVFLSDNGIAVPFAKTNCYLHSTRTPLIVRWPGVVEAGTVDDRHFVAGIDLLPTLLAALGLPIPDGTDGRAFVDLLRGGSDPTRDHVFTEFHETSAKRRYPMRCVQDARHGYIFNAWVDGETVFKNESQAGLTFAAMRRAARDDPAIRARVELFEHRVPEELYDFAADPDARHNLIDEPAHGEALTELRERLRAHLRATGDPLLAAFERRLAAAK